MKVNLADLDLKVPKALLAQLDNHPILQAVAATHRVSGAIPLVEVPSVDHLLGNPLPNLSKVHLVISFLLAFLSLPFQSCKHAAEGKLLKMNVSFVTWNFTQINNILSMKTIC